MKRYRLWALGVPDLHPDGFQPRLGGMRLFEGWSGDAPDSGPGGTSRSDEGKSFGDIYGGSDQGTGGDPVKDALYGNAGYGQGLTGAQTKAFDDTLAATGDVGQALDAMEAVKAQEDAARAEIAYQEQLALDLAAAQAAEASRPLTQAEYDEAYGNAFVAAVNRGQSFEAAAAYAARTVGPAPAVTPTGVAALPEDVEATAEEAPLSQQEQAYAQAYFDVIQRGGTKEEAQRAGDRAYDETVAPAEDQTQSILSSGMAQEISPPDLSGRLPDTLKDIVDDVASRTYDTAYNDAISRGSSHEQANAAASVAMGGVYAGAKGVGTVSPGQREEYDPGYIGGPADVLGDVSGLGVDRPAYETERGETSGLSSLDRAALYGDTGYGEGFESADARERAQLSNEIDRLVATDVSRPGGVAAVDVAQDEAPGAPPAGLTGPQFEGQLGLSRDDMALKDREDRLSYEPTGMAGASGWTPDTAPREGDPGFMGAVQGQAAETPSGALPGPSGGALSVSGDLYGGIELGQDIFQALDAINAGQALTQNLSFLVDRGYGAQEGINPNNPTQSVQEMLNASRLSDYLDRNMPSIIGMTMGPAAQVLTEAAFAMKKGYQPSSIVGMIVSSMIGSAIEMATGVRVPGEAVQDLAQGNVGKAAFGVGVENVARRLGVPAGTVNSVLRGDLGGAAANQILSEVVNESAKQMGADPGLIAMVAVKSGAGQDAFGKIAFAINQNSVVKDVNDILKDWSSKITSITADVPIGEAITSGGTSSGALPGEGAYYTSDGGTDSDQTGALPDTTVSGQPKKRIPRWSDLFLGNLARDLRAGFSATPPPAGLPPQEDLDQALAIANAYNDPSRRDDLLTAASGVASKSLDDQAMAELAALEMGQQYYDYNGKVYEANKQNLEAYADGRVLSEYTRLVDGALKEAGVRPSAITEEQRRLLTESAYREYGNDINRLSAASIQDFVRGNTASLSELAAYASNQPLRIDIRGIPIGGWSSEDMKSGVADQLPLTTKLATQEEFEDSQATLIYLPNGKAAWVVSKPQSETSIPGYQFERMPGTNPWDLDPEAALVVYSQFDSKPEGGAKDLVVNSAKAAVDLIQNMESATGGLVNLSPQAREKLIDVLATTAKSGGELVKNFSDLVWSTGLVDRENVASATANALINYSDQILSADAKTQQDNIMNAISGAGTLSEKYSALVRASRENPWGAALIVGGEVAQEVPTLLAGGAVGKFAAGLWGKAVGFAAARGTDATLGAAEAAGSAYAQTYDNIIKVGGSEDYAATQASKSAFQSAALVFGSDLLGDAALVKKFMGDVRDLSLSNVSKAASVQFITEGSEEFLQNLSTQYNSFGSVDMNQAMDAFVIGSVLGPAVSTSLLAPGAINYGMRVATGVDGAPVTLGEMLNGTVRVAPGTFDINSLPVSVGSKSITFGDLQRVVDESVTNPSFDVGSYRQNLERLGDSSYGQASRSDVALAMSTAPSAEALTDRLQSFGVDFGSALNIADMSFGDQVVTGAESAISSGSGVVLRVDPQTGNALVRAADGSLTVINDPAAQVGSSVSFERPPVQEPAPPAPAPAPLPPAPAPAPAPLPPAPAPLPPAPAPLPPAPAPAPAPATMTDDQVRQVVQEAMAANPGLTETQVQQIVNNALQGLPQGLTTADVSSVVNEAISKLPAAPTAQDINNAVSAAMSGAVTQQDLQQAIAGIQFPAGLTEADVTRAITDYMRQNPGLSPQDVAEQVGQQLRQLPAYATPADVESAIQGALTNVATRADVAAAIGNIQFPAGITEADVTRAITDYMTQNPGLSAQDVAQQVGDQLRQLPAYATPADVQSAINSALSGVATQADVAAAIAGIQFPAGITSQDVTNAISQYMQQNPGLSAADVAGQVSEQLAKLPTYATAADVDAAVRQALAGYATSADLSALSGNLEAVRAELSAAIAGAREQGLSGDSALAAGLEDLASQLGTTREGLVQSLGVTESALRSEFATQIGGVQTQISGLEQALQSAIADARASGVQGDDALRLGLESLAGTLGTTREDLLATMGRTEETLRGEFASQLSGTQSALSEAISGVEAGLTGQIGQLQKGFEDQFAAMSDSQQQEVLNRIQQGQDLAKAISDVQSGLTGAIAGVESGLTGQIGGLRQEVADQYRALSDAQKAEVDNRVQQGEDLSRAISAVQTGLEGRIGEVQTGLAGSIEGLRQDVTDQYRSLSDAQKQEVDNRVAMGESLENAIGGVKTGLEQRLSETQTALMQTVGGVQTGLTQQIGDLDTRFNARVDELVQQGQDQQTATNQAISEMSGGLTSLKEQQERDAKLQLSLQQQQGALQTASNLGASGRQQIIDPYKATFKDPFVVGGEATEFKSPLSGFLGSAMKSSFLPEMSADATQAPDRLGSEYFDMPGITGMQNPLDMYVETPFEGLYGFKAGGMVPLMAQGGTRHGNNAHGALRVLEHSGKHRVDYRQGDAVTGIGDGQSDDIPAMLADGEFVFPADVVAALGNGSTKAGSDKLYEMMHNIRRHHRSTGPKDLPPPAKSPLEYIKPRKGRR